jgi:hypothetical protein
LLSDKEHIMKINEILVESTQLNEGPFSDVAKNVGTNVGKAVGGVAKGVGAVAGGVAGIGQAVKKGYQSGKAIVGGDDEEGNATGQSQPAGTSPNQQQTNQTVYAQVKANIDKLDKKGKQRILNLLQKSLGQPAAPAAPAQTKQANFTPAG